MTRQTPNERPAFSFSQEDWAVAAQWRPFVYSVLARFGAKVMRRVVWWSGQIGTPTFQWRVKGGGRVYGLDPVSLMQDLEYRAIEAAARAAQTFDPGREVKFTTYLARVVNNALQDEFESWVSSSTSEGQESIDEAVGIEEPPPAGTSLSPEDEAALQDAMGVLTAKEAWALRMYADDIPIDVIKERLGHAYRASTYGLITRAKEKAAAAFVESQEAQAQ